MTPPTPGPIAGMPRKIAWVPARRAWQRDLAPLFHCLAHRPPKHLALFLDHLGAVAEAGQEVRVVLLVEAPVGHPPILGVRWRDLVRPCAYYALMHTSDTEWVRAKELARELGVSVSTVRRHVRSGEIPHVRFGQFGTILIPREVARGMAETGQGESDD